MNGNGRSIRLNNINRKKTEAPQTGGHFDFLDRTLNLLIVEDDPLSSKLLGEIFEPVSCYAVYFASTNARALELLKSGKRFHVCIVDLGITDMEGDEFYLLRHYGRHSSIVVLTGSPSPQKGAACIQLGARAVFEKGKEFNAGLFLRAVNKMALVNIVNHRFNEWSSDTINIATRILFEKHPASVTEWADNLRISDRQLRNLWHSNLGFGAKHVLFLFNCFSKAFEYYENIVFGNCTRRNIPAQYTTNNKQLAAYFRKHYEILTFLLT